MKLNLGSGNKRIEGFINIDYKEGDNVDIIHNLNHGLPFPENSVDYIRAYAIIEHLNDFMFFKEEVYRVLKPCGIIEILVPYQSAPMHPNHKLYFSWNSFDIFTHKNKGKSREKRDMFGVLHKELNFEMENRKLSLIFYLPFYLIYEISPRIFDTYLGKIIPVNTMNISLWKK